jgi:hypothetical protein
MTQSEHAGATDARVRDDWARFGVVYLESEQNEVS